MANFQPERGGLLLERWVLECSLDRGGAGDCADVAVHLPSWRSGCESEQTKKKNKYCNDDANRKRVIAKKKKKEKEQTRRKERNNKMIEKEKQTTN